VKVLFKGIFKKVLVDDLGMDAEKVSNQTNNIMTKGIGFDEDFLQGKPINDGRVNLHKLDSIDGHGTATAKNTANCNCSVLS